LRCSALFARLGPGISSQPLSDSTVVAHLDPRRCDSYGAAVASGDAARPTEDCPMTTLDATIDATTLEATVKQVFGYLGGGVIASMIDLGDHLGMYRSACTARSPMPATR
jgi:hypothetical protein